MDKIKSIGYRLIFNMDKDQGRLGNCNKVTKTVTLFLMHFNRDAGEYLIIDVQTQCTILCHELVHVMQYEKRILILPRDNMGLESTLRFAGLHLTSIRSEGYLNFVRNKVKIPDDNLRLEPLAYILERDYSLVLSY